MRIYDTELENPLFPRSLETVRVLVVVRGVTSDMLYAETFKIIKEIG